MQRKEQREVMSVETPICELTSVSEVFLAALSLTRRTIWTAHPAAAANSDAAYIGYGGTLKILYNYQNEWDLDTLANLEWE